MKRNVLRQTCMCLGSLEWWQYLQNLQTLLVIISLLAQVWSYMRFFVHAEFPLIARASSKSRHIQQSWEASKHYFSILGLKTLALRDLFQRIPPQSKHFSLIHIQYNEIWQTVHSIYNLQNCALFRLKNNPLCVCLKWFI